MAKSNADDYFSVCIGYLKTQNVSEYQFEYTKTLHMKQSQFS